MEDHRDWPTHEIPHPALVPGYRDRQQSGDLEERILNAMRIMARIISDDGEEYLPIFQRLEEALVGIQERNQTLERVRALIDD